MSKLCVDDPVPQRSAVVIDTAEEARVVHALVSKLILLTGL